jgi:hypothetical protein
MTTFDYLELRNIAAELLTEFGQSVTLKRIAAGSYDPATSLVTGDTSTSEVLKGALFDFGAKETHMGTTLVQAGDKRLLLQVGSSKPLLSDRVVINGTEYAILGVEETNPAGTAVVYALHLRR